MTVCHLNCGLSIDDWCHFPAARNMLFEALPGTLPRTYPAVPCTRNQQTDEHVGTGTGRDSTRVCQGQAGARRLRCRHRCDDGARVRPASDPTDEKEEADAERPAA